MNLHKFVNLYEAQQGGNAIEGNINATVLSRNFNYSKMADIQTSEMDEKLEPSNVGA
jgi:hypothetical protein